MISHTALSNKGIKKIDLARRHKKDFVDEDGEVTYKGDYVVDENGDIEFDRVEFLIRNSLRNYSKHHLLMIALIAYASGMTLRKYLITQVIKIGINLKGMIRLLT